MTSEVLLDLLASPLGKRRADKGHDRYRDGGASAHPALAATGDRPPWP